MKLVGLLPIAILVTGFIGYYTLPAFGLQQASTADQHCSASNPCVRICGDHVCYPGETYTGQTNNTTQNQMSNNTRTQNSTASVPTTPTASQNATGGNTTMGNVTPSTTPSGIPPVSTTSSSNQTSGIRMVTDSKMCLASVDRCVMVKKLNQSPRIQLSAGIGALDVSCKDGFQLVLKATDNSPACVRASTLDELVKSGWALSQDAMIKVKMMYEPNG